MLASRQPIVASVRRDAWVEVDLGAIEHNVKTVRSWLKPHTALLAVVKSDAYGHGAVGVSQLLVASGADWLGVASVDEGCQLRAAGITRPILLLSPPPAWALATAIDADLQLTVTSPTHVQDIVEASQRQSKIAKVHVKVDSGMHRLGVAPAGATALLEAVVAHRELKLTGLFSHLAKADDRQFTEEQNKTFAQVISAARAKGLAPELIHLASSDATRLFPETHYDMVRPGLLLYGLESKKVSDIVKPSMSVRGRINQLQAIEADQSVGYNLTWTAKRSSRIASIPIGYADGIDRRLSNRLQGLLHSHLVPQVGLISMDQMLFDITDVPSAQEGDIITLIGCDNAHAGDGPGRHRHWLYLADWAQQLDTITYELACRLRTRMPRVYTRHAVCEPKANE
jgi:alanine racemase